MGVYIITKNNSGQYKFSFNTRRAKTIFTSIYCKRKSDCELMIAGMSQNVENLTYTRNRRASGKLFFRISSGGFVLATSRNFNTEFSMKKAMDEVLRSASGGEIMDFSESDFIFQDAEAEESFANAE